MPCSCAAGKLNKSTPVRPPSPNTLSNSQLEGLLQHKCPAGTLTHHHTCDLGLAVSSAEKDTAIKATKQLLKGKQKVAACLRRTSRVFSLVTTAPEQGKGLVP